MVRAIFVGVKDKLENIQGARYILPISIGQPYHEGEMFEATIALLNRKGFQSCRIVLASVLQRHTLRLVHRELSEKELLKLSYDKGCEWYERNLVLLNRLNHPFEILDWSFFLETEEYQKRVEEMNKFYRDSSYFRVQVDETIKRFLNRWISRGIIKESEIAFATPLCMNYLIEECSVASTWTGQGFHYQIYPSSLAPAMLAMYEHFITPDYQDELVWIRVNLRGTTAIKSDTISESDAFSQR